jgi:hypothetical protein
VTDLAIGQDRWTGSRYEWERAHDGRHALDEDALLTPIFHALRSGGWQERQHEPAASHRLGSQRRDPLDEFRRDPLTAPIPVQAMSPAPLPEPSWRRSGHLRSVDPLTDSGRHRRIAENWGR